MRLWDVKTGKEIARFQRHTDRVNWIAFSPDGRQAVSRKFDKTVRVWDVATQRQLQELMHGGSLKHAVFLPDNRRVLSACNDNLVYLWDTKWGQCLHRFVGHTKQKMSVDVSTDCATQSPAAEMGRCAAGDCRIRMTKLTKSKTRGRK
jgi:WD40 repeat protein